MVGVQCRGDGPVEGKRKRGVNKSHIGRGIRDWSSGDIRIVKNSEIERINLTGEGVAPSITYSQRPLFAVAIDVTQDD